MFTKESLFEIAAKAEAEYNRLSIDFPAGTFNKERNDAYRTMNDAMACAEWMEKEDIIETANIGPFMTTIVKDKDQVKICKGAAVHCTLRSLNQKGLVTSRVQTVKVHNSFQGYVDHGHMRRDGQTRVVNGSISWAGTGGYWKSTDINNVIQEVK